METSRAIPAKGASGRRGFTIVEVLIVVAIIGVLIGLIVPIAGQIRGRAYEVRCVSNQRTMLQAFFAFAADHRGRLPGNFSDWNNPDLHRRSWLINENEPFTAAPESGTIWKLKYVQDRAVYLCPALEVVPDHSRHGSNGRFDYAAFVAFTGARLSDLQKTDVTFTYPDGRVERGLRVPLICEEEPFFINGGNLEGGHTMTDRVSATHRGGGYVGYADGTVGWFVMPPPTDARSWQARKPSGQMHELGPAGITYGWWDRN